MRIVVTGGMGCGKSTFVEQLRLFMPGYTFFDFDAAVHSLYDDPIVQAQLVNAFGTGERSAVRDIVYNSDDDMRRLGSIMNACLLSNTLSAGKSPNIVLDIPLFFEYLDATGQTYPCIDCVISVIAQPEAQRQRIIARNGYDIDKVELILSHQMSPENKAARSDFVFDTTNVPKDGMLEAVANFMIHHNLR